MPFFNFMNKKNEERGELVPEQDAGSAFLSSLLGGDAMDRDKAMQIPSVSACVDLIGRTVAALPVRLYERDSEGAVKEITDDGRLYLLNYDTGDTLQANQFWAAIIADYYLGKGGFAYINRKRGEVESLHYVKADDVSYIKGVDPIFKEYNLMIQGKQYHKVCLIAMDRSNNN